MYLVWFDDHPKKELRYKIIEAIDTYAHRFGERPTVVLVHAEQVIEPVEDVQIVTRPFIRPHYFWAGKPETQTQDSEQSSKAA